MEIVTQSIVIKAPQAKVFDLLSNAKSAPFFAPGIEKIEEIKSTKDRVGNVRYVSGALGGVRMRSKFLVKEFKKPHKVKLVSNDVLKSELLIELEKAKGGTKLTLTFKFILNTPLGGVIGPHFMKPRITRNMGIFLKDFKELVESGMNTDA